MSGTDRATFPSRGERLIVYRIAGSPEPLDDYVFIALRGLGSRASRVVAVLSEEPSSSDRSRLEQLCHEIVVPKGADDISLAEALDSGATDAARFDEIVITDDSWFGPVCALEPVFDRMDRVPAGEWTMTPAGRPGASAWVAVRPRQGEDTWHGLLATAARAAGEGFGPIDGGRDQKVPSAFVGRDAGADDPVLEDAHRLLAAGCPLLARRVFTSDPALLERHAVLGKVLLATAAENGYASDAALRSLARAVAPQRLNAALSLLTVLGASGPAAPPTQGGTVLAHFGSDNDGLELARRVALIPGSPRVVATTTAPDDVPRIRSLLASARDVEERAIEVRVLPPTADRVSATFVGCRDVLGEEGGGLVIVVHAGPAVEGEPGNIRRYLGRHTWENLFASREHASGVLALFDEPGLGLVFPPTPHIGIDTLGAGWDGGHADAERLARMSAVRVPLGGTPLRPVGGMWIARASALTSLVELDWQWEDYLPGSGWHSLGRAQEAILAHAVGERGFHTRTVMTAAHASISHAPLEYKLDQLASTIPGSVFDKIALLQRLGPVGRGRVGDFMRMYRRSRGVPSPGKRPS